MAQQMLCGSRQGQLVVLGCWLSKISIHYVNTAAKIRQQPVVSGVHLTERTLALQKLGHYR